MYIHEQKHLPRLYWERERLAEVRQRERNHGDDVREPGHILIVAPFDVAQGVPSASRGTDCGARIDIDIRADGFLRHMVRAIVGSLVDVGRGRREPEWIDDVLASRDRSQAGRSAPAEGLFLVSVEYRDTISFHVA